MLDSQKKQYLQTIASFPKQVRQRVIPLSDAQQRGRFLAEEWTVREIVHHCADSHMTSFIRLKLILTEDNPTVKPYDQDSWVKLADSTASPLVHSLNLLEGLHHRWVDLFSSLQGDQWKRQGFHPEDGSVITPETLLAGYAGHCEVHLDQMDRVLAAQ
jgi:hypothetical protein